MNVIYDVFPAQVLVIPAGATIPDTGEELTVFAVIPSSRRVDAVRVVLTDATVLIAADSPNGPTLIFRERYDRDSLSLDKSRSKTSSLMTESGKTVIFVKDDNCGCGSRLRTWNPYRTAYSTKDPIE